MDEIETTPEVEETVEVVPSSGEAVEESPEGESEVV